MKIIHKTKKYLHVRMTEDEYQRAKMHQNIHDRAEAYRKWFKANHHRVTGEDDYGCYESYWVENKTGKMVPEPQGIIL